MPKFVHKLHVEMEDGTEFDVTADQRDSAKWEVQPFGCSLGDVRSKLFTYQRFIAWSAAKRQGKTALTWDKFDEQSVAVDPVVDAEPEADAENPGQPAA